MFKKRGLIHVPKTAATEDRMMEIVLDGGGDDVKDAGELWEIETDPHDLEGVKDAIVKAGLAVTGAELTMIPGNRVHLDAQKAETMLKLMHALEDDDDVQNVSANFDIDDDVLERLTA
jgi:transcriptional/translational regulatory protein YebC/TACO1